MAGRTGTRRPARTGAGARELLDEVVASVDRFSDDTAPSEDDSAALATTARRSPR
ncbi:hypothetical protein LUW77_24230 [Streptomyces radiopugnans]|nr:hypothetical protein LUW77_24230 [Streptomyces radiopugnans]